MNIPELLHGDVAMSPITRGYSWATKPGAEEMFRAIARVLKNPEDPIVHIVLEPGDMTRYEFTVYGMWSVPGFHGGWSDIDRKTYLIVTRWLSGRPIGTTVVSPIVASFGQDVDPLCSNSPGTRGWERKLFSWWFGMLQEALNEEAR